MASAWWEQIYREAFPGLAEIKSVVGDCREQRAGIDRILTMSNGRQFLIEEKVRYEEYGDILLEFLSSVEHYTPGWIEKDLACDYLAYVVAPSRRCYMFPFPLLRKAWQRNAGQWIEWARKKQYDYKIIDSPNEGYTTRNLAIKESHLWQAMHWEMMVEWQEQSEGEIPF